jgi:hypothetical protein
MEAVAARLALAARSEPADRPAIGRGDELPGDFS